MISLFGFVADVGKTIRHNLAIQLNKYPADILSFRPTNLACHNLCSTLIPPSSCKSLLGLGLKFCPRPRYTTNFKQFIVVADRFRRDLHTQYYFSGNRNELDPDLLFVRSNWAPDPNKIPLALRVRTNQFLCALLERHFSQGHKVPSNLTPLQRLCLRQLCQSDDFIIVPADKNLGLCIIERANYIKRALQDHLGDQVTYTRLSEPQAITCISRVKVLLADFIDKFRNVLSFSDLKFLQRTSVVDDLFSYFYIIMKIHKNPWKTRPIVSYSGSLLYGLGKWLVKQLHPLIRSLPSYLRSSSDLKDLLSNLHIPKGKRISLFSFDADSMYTNIDTDHALFVIAKFLCLKASTNTEAIIQALEIIMRNNNFKFGDTFWHQETGTAMGTPPAPDYATLYFGIHELSFIAAFSVFIAAYKRYIDDGLCVWIHDDDSSKDDLAFSQFQDIVNCYGKLRWTFTDRVKELEFMDLLITIDDSNKITTKIYEKPLNLYQYIPPHSAHAPGISTGFISGLIKRIFRLTSFESDQKSALRKLYARLSACGYPYFFPDPVFQAGLKLRVNSKNRPD